MNISKVFEFLEKQKKKLHELKKKHHKDGEEQLNQIEDQIKMIIRRIYPNPTEIERKFFPGGFAIVTDNDAYHQERYLDEIKDINKAINTILSEKDLFGFEDFTPEKEKTVSELEISTRRIGWLRKKTKKRT